MVRWGILCLALSACEAPPKGPPGGADLIALADLGAGGQDLGPGQGSGLLRVSALDDETGQPMPARVIVTAVGPTPAVRFDYNLQGKIVNGDFGVGLAPGVIGAPEGVLLVGGDGAWPVPAGTYDVFVTRGPEWEAEEKRVTITGKTNAAVVAMLRHSVDTRGWLAADLHVHTGRSYDSRIQVEDRVVTEVAVGVELIVTTDHNVLSDLQPDVELFGYGRIARAIVGDEFNFYEGHGGAYPMPYDPKDPFGGTVGWGLDWDRMRFVHSADAFAFLHAFDTHPAVTINHPRLPPDLGYFINLKQYGPDGWAPPMSLTDAGTFDALELLNGYMETPDDLRALLRDWFFLLNGGTRVAAIGSSDTHKLADVKAGFPRTWLRMPSEDVTKLLDTDLADAIRAQRTIASNGPFANLVVNGAKIGEVAAAKNGQVVAEVTVDAPGWIDVDKVRLFVNGQEAWSTPVARGVRPLFHASVPIPVAGDSWIALQVSGSEPLPTALIGEHSAGAVLPFAITSPVFIDADGDQKWKPTIPPDKRDPGPLGPLGEPIRWLEQPAHPAPQDCEPPLWTDPARWVIP
jgi:hypothetical protein